MIPFPIVAPEAEPVRNIFLGAEVNSAPFQVCADLRNLVCDNEIGKENYKYFEDSYQCTILNAAGQKKLASDWSEIWDEFKLGA